MRRKLISLPLALMSMPAVAQRTADNAVTSAGDAFGKAVGNERIGLYSVDDVRGFNPIDAGNARIEGLFFSQVDRPSSRLIEGSTIRVGITAQGYAFPAPTGIVDYQLTLPGAAHAASFEIERGPYGGAAGSVEASVPLRGDRLGIAAGVGFRHQLRPEGGDTDFKGFGMSARWRPYAGAQIIGFYGGLVTRGEEATPTFFPAGAALPPKIKRRRNIGQSFTDRNSNGSTYGLIAKLPAGDWRAEAAMFRSRRSTATSFADLFIGVTPDGNVVDHRIIADGDNLDDAISGEARLIREWQSATLRQRLIASLRGRDLSRDFAGVQRLSFGATTLLTPVALSRPAIALAANDHDQVRQFTAGLAYALNWAKHGTVDVSIAKTAYRKRIDFAAPLINDTDSRSKPLLYSAAASAIILPKLSLYAGLVRGLEEAPVAPDIAVNRGEAPPAVLTRQADAGLRLAVTPKLSLVAGLFSVRKSYYNLDNARLFRQLGSITNRGIELSVAGSLAKGLNLVAGTLFLDPKIDGAELATLGIGSRPVGSITRRAVANLDWRPGGDAAWSFDLAFEGLSARTANAANSLKAPARESVALGTRYRLKLGDQPVLLRVQATNLFNDYGFQVSSSGGFTYSAGRTFVAQLIADI